MERNVFPAAGRIEKILLNKKPRDYPKKWWSRSFLYVLFLQALEPVKIPFLRHELFIASDLGDAAVFDKGDTVGLADGGKPVSDNEGGAFSHHVVGGLTFLIRRFFFNKPVNFCL